MQHKVEWLFAAACIGLGLVWAVSTDHFPMAGFKLDYLIDISSLLTVASFSVRAMLPLRLLAVASQLIAVPYFVLQPTPLWTPVGWTSLFIAINAFHIVRILLERRPIELTGDARNLYDLSFAGFSPNEFQKLLGIGEWRDASKGDVILQQGAAIKQISVPISGRVAASLDDQAVGELCPGDLIGSGLALTRQVSFYTARFEQDARYMTWQIAELDSFLSRNPDIRLKFNDVVNRHLVAQLNKLALRSRDAAVVPAV